MIALIKQDKNGLDIITEPIPEWIDAIAFAVFDCYGYALCPEYTPREDDEDPVFEFSTREIKNPWKQSEEDPDMITVRSAVQIS